MEFLKQILYTFISAAVPVLTVYACRFLQSSYEAKKNQIKNERVRAVMDRVVDVVTSTVQTTTATYVKQLKADNLFDADAQKEAFNITYNTVKKQLTDESVSVISEIYGDLDTYLTNAIESTIEYLK